MSVQSITENSVQSWVINLMDSLDKTITPSELGRLIGKKFSIKRSQVKRIIQYLISCGELEYIDVYGRTVIIPSFSKPVKITSKIILKPPGVKVNPDKQEIVITLEKGIAFGRGNHPTTRLCLEALTDLFENEMNINSNLHQTLDIGTGTGVLAIAAALFGSKYVYGCDIDSIAVQEAKKNVCLNNLEERVDVDTSFSKEKFYDLIIANLRYPTLISLYETMDSMLLSSGYFVLSGMKTDEVSKIISCYKKNNAAVIWKKSDKQWCAIIFKKP